jgi:hypothetical protein
MKRIFTDKAIMFMEKEVRSVYIRVLFIITLNFDRQELFLLRIKEIERGSHGLNGFTRIEKIWDKTAIVSFQNKKSIRENPRVSASSACHFSSF